MCLTVIQYGPENPPKTKTFTFYCLSLEHCTCRTLLGAEPAKEAEDPLEDHQESMKDAVEPTDTAQGTDEDTSPCPDTGVTDAPEMSTGDPGAHSEVSPQADTDDGDAVTR